MTKNQIAAQIRQTSRLTGVFTLRSGKTSNEYFDKYQFESDPVLLDAITDILIPLIPEEAQVLAGLEMGALAVAAALSSKTGVKTAFVRKKPKEYGTRKFCEGADVSGKNVCVIEDVVTTGGQIIESADMLRGIGAKVSVVVCVILREERAKDILAAEGLQLRYGFTIDELA